MLIVTTESDLLFVHPDYNRFVRGMIVASTYPLMMESQALLGANRDLALRNQFSSSDAEGVYNATIALLNYAEDGTPSTPSSPPLLDYQTDESCRHRLAARGAPDVLSKIGCMPPLWISVVGRDGLWPIVSYTYATKADPDKGSFEVDATTSAVFAVNPDSPYVPPNVHVVWPSLTVIMGLIVTAVVCLATITAFVAARVERFDQWTAQAWFFDLFRPRPGIRLYEAVVLFALASFGVFASVIALLALNLLRGRLFLGTALYISTIGSWAGSTVCLAACAGQAAIDWQSQRKRRRQFAGPAADNEAAFPFARRGILMLAGALAFAAMYFLVVYAAPFVQTSSGRFVRSFERMTHPSNGLSPIVPAACVTSALALWALFHLRRLRESAMAEAVGTNLLTEVMLSKDPRAWQQRMLRTLRGPTQGLPASWVAMVWLSTLGSVTFIISRQPITIEPSAYTKFFICFWMLVQVVTALSIAQVLWMWRLTGNLLAAVNEHPIAPAFRRIAGKVAFARHRFSFQAPDTDDLSPLVSHRTVLALGLRAVSAMRAGAGMGPHAAAGPGAVTAVDRRAEDPERGAAAVGFHVPPEQLQTLVRGLESPTAYEEQRETRRHWTLAGTWITLLAEAPQLIALLKTFWARVPAAMRPGEDRQALDTIDVWHRRAEELIAMEVTLVVRELLSRTMSYLMLILALLVLMVTALSSVPIQPKEPLLAFAWVYVTISVAVGLTIVIAMERDPILSRLSGTKPNRVTWDLDFVLKLVLYGLVPLLTLFAAQFPDIGNTLLRWVAPIQPLP